jgi:hypothetical protein
VPARGLFQVSRSSSRQHALHAMSAAHTAAARRCGGAVNLSTRAVTQLARTRGDPAAGGKLRIINQFTAEAKPGLLKAVYVRIQRHDPPHSLRCSRDRAVARRSLFSVAISMAQKTIAFRCNVSHRSHYTCLIREHVRGGVECQSRVQLRGYTSVRGTERLLTPLYFIFASKNGTCCFTCEGTIRRNGGVRLDRQLVWSFLWWHLELSSVSSSAGARSRVMPPHRPREDGLAHPANTSRTNLADAWLCFRGGFPSPL